MTQGPAPEQDPHDAQGGFHEPGLPLGTPPAYPHHSNVAAAAMVPRSLRYATYAWIGYLLVDTVGRLVAGLNSDGGRSVSQLVALLVVLVVGGFVIRQLYRGHAWARLLSTAYAALVMAAALAVLFGAGLGSAVTDGYVLVQVLTMVLAVVAVVYMYLPDADRYIKAPDTRRAS